MYILLILLFGQCIFAVVVIFILKNLLDKELIRSALEKFESCKNSDEIKEIEVRTASFLSQEFKGYLESIAKRKMPQARLNFCQDPSLKGGIVIMVGGLHLDFSLQGRLEHLW